MKAYIPKDPANYWRDVPGYAGKYQVSRMGEVRRVFGSGKVRDLHPYPKSCATKLAHHPRWYIVKLDGKEQALHKLVARTWLPAPAPGLVAYHKNGIQSDNRVDNIGFTTPETLGRITGAKSKRMTVFKISEDGEVVAIYSSAREAARMNNMSYQTVLDRCHDRVANPFALDGFNYQFEDAPPGKPKRKRGRKK